jgi:phosphatidylserine/phosphatidylglycerophosphate/cardiolipin synthase-like enzyme
MADGKIIKSIIDAIAVALQIIESAENEVAWLVPRPALIYASQYGVNDISKVLIQKGVHIRGITDISYPYIDIVRERLDIGEDVRHFEKYQGEFMLIGDVRQGLSSINIDVESLSLDTPVVALWTDDPTYAEYLMSTFEVAWEQAVPAAQRIEELLKKGPPNI